MVKMKDRKLKHSEVALLQDLKTKIRKAETRGDFKELAILHNSLGYEYRRLRKFEDALEEHELEKAISLRTDDPMGVAIAYRNIGEVYLDMKDEKAAIKPIKTYLKMASDEGNVVEKQRAFITLGRIYLGLYDKTTSEEFDSGNLDSQDFLNNAETFFEKASVMLENSELKSLVQPNELAEMQCGAWQNIGIVLDSKGCHSKALVWLNKAIQIGEEKKFLQHLHSCYVLCASLYGKLNNSTQAIISADRSIKVAKQLKNVSLEVESVILLCKIYLQNGDIEPAKLKLKMLRSKIKKSKSDLNDYLSEVNNLLKTTYLSNYINFVVNRVHSVLKICHFQEIILNVTENDEKRKSSAYEVMGDCFALIQSYDEAIRNYTLALETLNVSAEAVPDVSKRSAKLYYSIALTYRDKGDEKNALKYFLKEIDLDRKCSNALEEFRTQTNITVSMEKLEKPIEEMIKAHELAVDLAKKCNVRKLVIALQNYALYLRCVGTIDHSEKLLQEIEVLKVKHEISDLDEDENDSQDLLCDDEFDVNLSELSSESESDGNEDEEPKPRNEKAKSFKLRLNELGETQLHIAAKNGNIKAARKLLSIGFPVNVRDKAGWLPIHEACNFGHYEMAALLLEHKANVNDNGGELCEKITPLHDASSNGHLDVMKLLIDKGANVLAKDAHGNYPIDAFIAWRFRNEIDEGEDEAKFLSMKDYMMKFMETAGRPYTRRDEQHALRRLVRSSENPSNETTLLEDEEINVPAKIVTDQFDPNDPDAAVDLYSETMRHLRRSRKSASKKYDSDASKKASPKRGLISEGENVTEGWLLNDVCGELHRKSKRKRDPFDEVTFSEGSRRRRKVGSIKNPSIIERPLQSTDTATSYSASTFSNTIPLTCLRSVQNLKKPISAQDISIGEDMETETFPTSPRTFENSIRDESESDEESLKFSTLKRRRLSRTLQGKLPFKKVSPKCSSPERNINTIPESLSERASTSDSSHKVLRLRVKVMDKVLLIPVYHHQMNSQISWLCDAIAERYMKQHGVKPLLTLSTEEGALLDNDDVIGGVLDEEVKSLVASVESFDLQPILQRYKKSCQELNIDSEKKVEQAMLLCQSSNLLVLSDTFISGKTSTALFNALQRQNALKELHLTGCYLYDVDIKNLSKSLPTLTGLTVLDLSNNGITASGLHYISDSIAKRENQAILPLRVLNFSFNPLGNSVSPFLSQILENLPNVRVLSLCDCDFTCKLFERSKLELVVSLQKSKLEEIDFSCNFLGTIGTEKLLQCIVPGRLKKLNLSSLEILEPDQFSNVFKKFLSQNEDCCRLKELNLADCCLDDNCIEVITSEFSRLVSLETFDISNNEGVSLKSLLKILTKSIDAQLPLKFLKIGCCPMLWDDCYSYVDATCNALDRKMLEGKLRSLELTSEAGMEDSTKGNIEKRIAAIWEEYSGNEAFYFSKAGHTSIFEYRTQQ